MSQKQNVLSAVQEMMSRLKNDNNITSVYDTDDAYNAALMLQDVFDSLVSQEVIPEHKTLLELQSIGDSRRPAMLKIPDYVSKIETFFYNIKPNVFSDVDSLDSEMKDSANTSYKEVEYLCPSDFLCKVFAYASNSSSTVLMEYTSNANEADVNSIRIPVKNNKSPSFWTTFDETHLVTDSWDSMAGDTLHNSKTLVYGRVFPVFKLEDDFVPNVDKNLWHYIKLAATIRFFDVYRNGAPPVLQREAIRLKVRMANHDKSKTPILGRGAEVYGRSRPYVRSR